MGVEAVGFLGGGRLAGAVSSDWVEKSSTRPGTGSLVEESYVLTRLVVCWMGDGGEVERVGFGFGGLAVKSSTSMVWSWGWGS